MEAAISTTEKSKRERKEEGKLLKRQRIETSGGVRPRASHVTDESKNKPSKKPTQPKHKVQKNGSNEKSHRFGRVMDQTPCPGRPRLSTLSIAVPGSIVSNAQTRELKTYLVSQIARAATIYHVDEIIVFDDKLSVNRRQSNNRPHQQHRRTNPESSDIPVIEEQATGTVNIRQDRPPPSDPHTFMARLLQYCECPQYLRRNFFPMHPDLQFAGLLPPTDAPHHVREGDRCKYREGVVMDKTGRNGNSLVNCGIRNRPVE
jgi:hypothetical protein